jgi:hypothetical protein
MYYQPTHNKLPDCAEYKNAGEFCAEYKNAGEFFTNAILRTSCFIIYEKIVHLGEKNLFLKLPTSKYLTFQHFTLPFLMIK